MRRRLLTIIGVLVLVISLASCKHVSAPSKYVDDNNYFYVANYKCRADASEEVKTVESITFENKRYIVDEVIDYYVYNSEIYMLTTDDKNRSDNWNWFLIKYSPLTNSTNVIYGSLNDTYYVNEINFVNDEAIVFGFRVSVNSILYRYDLASNRIDKYNNLSTYVTTEKGVLIETDESYYVLRYECDTKPVKTSIPNDMYIGQNVIVNNNEYIMLTKYARDFGIYCVDTNEYKLVYSCQANYYAHRINDEYYVQFTETPQQYYLGGSLVDITSYDHCSILKIDYESMTMKVVYTFENQNDSYTSGWIVDNVYYDNASYIIKGTSLSDGEHRYYYISVDLETGRYKRCKNVKYNKEPDDDSIKYGDYTYYLHKEREHHIMWVDYYYKIYRIKNGSTKKEYLQFFGINAKDLEGSRYTLNTYYYLQYFEEKYVLILNK